MADPISLREYQTRAAVPLTLRQRDQLLALDTGISVAPTPGTDDRYDLTPGSKVGAIHLEGLDVVVQPKVPLDRLLFVLSYAMPYIRDLREPLALEAAPDLPEAIVAAFLRHAHVALARGVQQGYRTRDDSSLTMRGRLRVGDQMRRRYGPMPPVEITYDDFTVDIEINQLVLAAAERLLRLPLTSRRLLLGLRGIVARLEGVTLVGYDARRLPSVTFTRLNERYRGAVGLATMILRSMSFDLAHGSVPATAFLVDMNRAFEEFIVGALRVAIGVGMGQLVQGGRGRPLFLDEGRAVSLQPDLSLWREGRCLWVGDVKYKKVASLEYPNADIYQATAYAIATGLDDVTLIYAAGEREPGAITVVNVGKRVEVVTIDLTVPPAALLGQVQEIAGRMLARAAVATAA